jgi:hypothetical protein
MMSFRFLLLLILGCGMAERREIIETVEAFLDNSLSLQDFEDWSAEFSWDIHKRADPDVQALAYQVRAILNAFSEDDFQDGLRKELAAAIRPFAEIPVYSKTMQLVYGRPFLETGAFKPIVLHLCAVPA